ncbi:hypothetical protein HNQ07_000043 [Deinococcus metalli]|uniref:Peptidase S8/S53 domain-containing protein n=1 Tax=Deinococcus metalli TaxID=1141878 RepID=A0A7W8NLD0_9DEIO|nr:S8 family serine peptidase [Deinococcus metalli]MBB5374599.1 hypothetical protein [Deinococcus metalli]GHF35121.1 hypothetical protein GCM10017781_09980 [Deinococcus metalli]
MRTLHALYRFVLPWPLRVTLLAAVLLGLHAGTAAAQPARTATAPASFAVFPPVASPGERMWLIGRALDGTRAVWIGGHAAKLSPDRPAGWYAFDVPRDVPGGPQGVSVQGPAQPAGPGVGTPTVTIVPTPRGADGAANVVTAYLRAQARPTFAETYRARVQQLAEVCARACPDDLTQTVRALAGLNFSALEPLAAPAPQGTRGPATARPALRSGLSAFALDPQVLTAARLDRVLRAPAAGAPTLAAGGLCAQLGGDIDLGTLPPGRVIALLTLLLPGDLGVDPILGGYPTATGAVPFQGTPPATMLHDAGVLGPFHGGGRGVTIHVLDTASAGADPYSMADVNYYNEIYALRPGHGAAVGAVAQAVAPDATVVLRQVCGAGASGCRTLNVVRALCEVVRDAQRGGKHVVNLSMGGPYPSVGLRLALDDLRAAGVPTAASFGNRDDCHGLAVGDRCSHYPADWTVDFALAATPGAPTTLLSVAGWDIEHKEYATYNRTAVVPWALTALPSVQVPGEFWVQLPGMTAAMPYFGTSFAAPVVAGILANWMECQPGLPALPLLTTPGQSPVPGAVLNACP